jgi:hypothetical protein
MGKYTLPDRKEKRYPGRDGEGSGHWKVTRQQVMAGADDEVWNACNRRDQCSRRPQDLTPRVGLWRRLFWLAFLLCHGSSVKRAPFEPEMVPLRGGEKWQRGGRFPG